MVDKIEDSTIPLNKKSGGVLLQLESVPRAQSLDLSNSNRQQAKPAGPGLIAMGPVD